MSIKKITETKYKYDDKGNLIEKTETVTEYVENYAPLSPTVPINPYQYTITCKNLSNNIMNSLKDIELW